MLPYMGDVWVIGSGVGNASISVCPFTIEGLGLEEDNAEQCLMPWYYWWWRIPPPGADKMVRFPVAPGYIYFGLWPISLVLTRAAFTNEMLWASMAMHYTVSLPIMAKPSQTAR